MKKIHSNWVRAFLLGTILIFIYRIAENYEGFLKAAGNFLSVFTPCIIGIIIAFFLWKPSEKIEKLLEKTRKKFLLKGKRIISVLGLYAVIFIVLALCVNFLLPGLKKNVLDLAQNTPSYIKKAEEFLNENQIISEIGLLDTISEKIGDFVKENFTLNKINKYVSVLGALASSFMNFFLGVVFSIYILLERDGIKKVSSKAYDRFIQGHKRDIIKKYAKDMVGVFYSYFAGLSLDALIVGTITAIALTFFRVPYAVLLGFLVALGNMIPFFGPIVATVITYIIGAVSIGPVKALWVLLFQIILGQIDSNLIQPRILSKSTGVNPLLVLLAVIVFGDLFGFFGMILGVPIMATIKIFVKDYFDNGMIDASAS